MDIRYAKSSGDIDIAYAVLGDGPVDLVVVPGFVTHLDMVWDLPHYAWLEQLDGTARVIAFDKRGTGLSDRSLGFGSVEERADDALAVMDAAGSKDAIVLGISEGGPMALVLAATHPERVRGLALYGTAARFRAAPDYPFGLPEDVATRILEHVPRMWGTGAVFDHFMQNAKDPRAARRALARFERNACTPNMALEILRRNLEIDVRDALPAVQAPTLVVHQKGDPVVPVQAARYLAERIPGARWRELPNAVHGSWQPQDMADLRDEVCAFLQAAGAPPRPADRVLATVLFTDITGSTELATRVGDRAWHELLDQHDRICARHVERFGGRVVGTTGDGVLASFEGPGRAVQCAAAISEALGPLGLRIRTGVHTGEVELRGSDLTGLGVVIARRICDLAVADEVLVSRTVKELAAGSGIAFLPRGQHALKGVPEEWELFAARP